MRWMPTMREMRLSRVWALLSRRDQKKIVLITGVQILSGLLDLLGVVLIGVIGALAVSGFGTQQTGSKIADLLAVLRLADSSLQVQVGFLGCLAAVVLVAKTIFSVYYTRKILNYLSHKSAELSTIAVQQTLKMSVLSLQAKPHQEILFSLTSGPSVLMVGILGTSIALVADASLLILLATALLIVDPLVATSSVVMFLGIGIILYNLLHKRATYLGSRMTELNISSGTQIYEVLMSYRFLTVSNRKEFFSRKIGNLRTELGAISGENAFMPYISKYVIETVVVLGTLILAASQFLLQDATHAVATLSIFMAAGSRIAPAALRIQQGALLVKNNLGLCIPALEFLEGVNLKDPASNFDERTSQAFGHEGFIPNVKVSKVNFIYPGSDTNALTDVTFEIPQGSVTSIVGESGSGKSTLADVVLGLLSPNQGEVLISDKPTTEALMQWPGATAYVPQDVALINGSIRENVALGFDSDLNADPEILEALKLAQLMDFVLELPEGLNTIIGERGTRLSGGQRQRLGIARALFTKPRLIVLDEATSALDGATEAEISSAIHSLKGTVTILMIAHRLSTVKESDQVIYLSNGRLVSQGSFEKVRAEVPDFEKQAKLMGL